MSGGQKARLVLARALYENSDILLLDDPLSAVDSQIAKQLFDNCLKPLSHQKIVILVSHQLHYIEQCDCVMILESGKIKAQGKQKDILRELKNLK